MRRPYPQKPFTILNIKHTQGSHSDLCKEVEMIASEIKHVLERTSNVFKEKEVKDEPLLNDTVEECKVDSCVKICSLSETDKLKEDSKLTVTTAISVAKRELEANSLVHNNFLPRPMAALRPALTIAPRLEKTFFTKLPTGRVVGQFDQKFIVLEINGEVYLVDQHAAHERVLLEKIEGHMLTYLNEDTIDELNSSMDAGSKLNSKIPTSNTIIKSTILSKPVTLPYDSLLKDLLIERQEILSKMWGIKYNIINDSQIIVLQLSNVCGFDIAPSHLFDFIKVPVSEELKLHVLPKCVHDSMKLRACRSAVKFGDSLKRSEMEGIVEMLAKCSLPSICAHGTIFSIANQ